MYLTMSSGIAMDIHYCMGEKAGVDFYAAESKKCGRCGMKTKQGCCNDEHKFYKLGAAHKDVSSNYNFTVNSIGITHNYAAYVSPAYFPVILAPANNLSPPAAKGDHIYIRNCVFRI